MKHIRNFQSYQKMKRKDDVIRESVLEVNDMYKVKSMVDIPQSLINAYVKKVKEATGKNLRTFFGDVDIAEEIVKYITMNFLDVDKIPSGALIGGQSQAQAQAQVQAEEEKAQTEEESEEETQAEPQAQPQAQSQEKEEEAEEESQEKEEEDFEEVQETEEETEEEAEEESQSQPEGEELPE